MASKKFNAAERNWPTHERELYALVSALGMWRYYLLGSRGVAFTDNSAVKWLSTSSTLSPRQARWLAILQEFDIEFCHIPGRFNTAADALSRPADEETVEMNASNEEAHPIIDEDTLPEDAEVPQFVNVPSNQTHTFLDDNWRPDYANDEELMERYDDEQKWENGDYVFHNDKFYHHSRIVVPSTRVNDVIALYHSNLVTGHWGISKR